MIGRAILAASALAVVACAPAEAPGPPTVSGVEVDVELSAIPAGRAGHHWETLEADIAGALGREFVGMIRPEGYLVRVDVDERSLAALAGPRLGADEARLTGRVELVDVLSDRPVRSFTVGATANQAAAFLPPGVDAAAVPPTSHAFHEAVVRAFAHGAAEAVRSGRNPPA